MRNRSGVDKKAMNRYMSRDLEWFYSICELAFHDLLCVLSYRSCSHHKYSCRLHVDQICSHHMFYMWIRHVHRHVLRLDQTC